jgi:hypothetical protein
MKSIRLEPNPATFKTRFALEAQSFAWHAPLG